MFPPIDTILQAHDDFYSTSEPLDSTRIDTRVYYGELDTYQKLIDLRIQNIINSINANIIYINDIILKHIDLRNIVENMNTSFNTLAIKYNGLGTILKEDNWEPIDRGIILPQIEAIRSTCLLASGCIERVCEYMENIEKYDTEMLRLVIYDYIENKRNLTTSTDIYKLFDFNVLDPRLIDPSIEEALIDINDRIIEYKETLEPLYHYTNIIEDYDLSSLLSTINRLDTQVQNDTDYLNQEKINYDIWLLTAESDYQDCENYKAENPDFEGDCFDWPIYVEEGDLTFSYKPSIDPSISFSVIEDINYFYRELNYRCSKAEGRLHIKCSNMYNIRRLISEYRMKVHSDLRLFVNTVLKEYIEEDML